MLADRCEPSSPVQRHEWLRLWKSWAWAGHGAGRRRGDGWLFYGQVRLLIYLVNRIKKNKKMFFLLLQVPQGSVCVDFGNPWFKEHHHLFLLPSFCFRFFFFFAIYLLSASKPFLTLWTNACFIAIDELMWWTFGENATHSFVLGFFPTTNLEFLNRLWWMESSSSFQKGFQNTPATGETYTNFSIRQRGSWETTTDSWIYMLLLCLTWRWCYCEY